MQAWCPFATFGSACVMRNGDHGSMSGCKTPEGPPIGTGAPQITGPAPKEGVELEGWRSQSAHCAGETSLGRSTVRTVRPIQNSWAGAQSRAGAHDNRTEKGPLLPILRVFWLVRRVQVAG